MIAAPRVCIIFSSVTKVGTCQILKLQENKFVNFIV